MSPSSNGSGAAEDHPPASVKGLGQREICAPASIEIMQFKKGIKRLCARLWVLDLARGAGLWRVSVTCTIHLKFDLRFGGAGVDCI